MDYVYSRQDLESIHDFMAKNPKATMEELDNHFFTTLTQEERDWFKFVEIAEFEVPINGRSHKFYVVNWNGVGGGHYWKPVLRFIQKYFDEWYRFETDYNSDYRECVLITEDGDFFAKAKDWGQAQIKLKGMREIRQSLGKAEFISTYIGALDDKSDLELGFEQLHYWRMDMDRNYCHFYIGSDFDVYMSGLENLEFKPALPLLEEKLTGAIIEVTQPTFAINKNNPVEVSYNPEGDNWKMMVCGVYPSGLPKPKKDEILYKLVPKNHKPKKNEILEPRGCLFKK